VAPPDGTHNPHRARRRELATRSSSDGRTPAPSPASCSPRPHSRSNYQLMSPASGVGVMFAPMRPRPTIPNCMFCSLIGESSAGSLPERIRRSCPDFETMQVLFAGLLPLTLPKPHSRRSRDARGARAFRRSASTWNRHAPCAALTTPNVYFCSGPAKIQCVVASHLQENSGVWSSFVSLSCRMQKTRSETQAGKPHASCRAPHALPLHIGFSGSSFIWI